MSDVVVGHGQAETAEAPARQIHTARLDGVLELLELRGFVTAEVGIAIVADVPGVGMNLEQAPPTGDLPVDTGSGDRCTQAAADCFSHVVQACERSVIELVHSGEPSGHGDGIRRERPTGGHLGACAARPSKGGHRPLAPRNTPDGEAAADDLGHGGDVGVDAEQRLRPAIAQPERDHLVEHQQRTHLAGRLANRSDELWLDHRQSNLARHHVEQHCGQTVAMALDGRAGALGVVEVDDADLFDHRVRRARCVWHRGRRLGIAPVGRIGRQAGFGMVIGAVIGALHLDDIWSTGECPRSLERTHHRFSAGVAEPDELEALDPAAQQRRKLDLDVARQCERRAPRHLRAHCLDDGGVGVPHDERSEVVVAVEIAVAVDVSHPRALAVIHIDRVRPSQQRGSGDAVGNPPLCPGIQRSGLCLRALAIGG